MKPKNTTCLWFDKDAHEAARFYAATFPDSKVTAVHQAPGDYPSGKKGDVLTVEFNRPRPSLWLANCYFSSHRACNIVTSCRRVSVGCTGGR
jgi:predicted 3-demethylubiquinone-9 3-methyltransferase (glyoxalase superfamily)